MRPLIDAVHEWYPFTGMLSFAAIFLVIAIIMAALGFGGPASGAAASAKALFFIFLLLFLATLIFGSVVWKRK